MGYLHIDNLYKNQAILMFKECYALEKIHGTSAHVSWDHKRKKVGFFAGGERHERFVGIFDEANLEKVFSENFLDSDAVVYGEAYGGKCQGMSATYGMELKFVAFDVMVGPHWLNVPAAESVVQKLGLEFVDYRKISTDLEMIDHERDKWSTQAERNGVGTGKLREGVVLRPLIELTMNNGARLIAKHKRDEFKETKTPRTVDPEAFKVLTEANAIADEWVTEMRLSHVLDKLPKDIGMESTRLVINAMIEDVYREAKGEIVESKEVSKAISNKAVAMFKKKLQNAISNT